MYNIPSAFFSKTDTYSIDYLFARVGEGYIWKRRRVLVSHKRRRAIRSPIAVIFAVDIVQRVLHAVNVI